jgi:hypothetical protein
MKLRLPANFRHQPRGIRSKSCRPYLPTCPWRLTYARDGEHFSETIVATCLESAALLIGKGIPIAADFDDRSNGSWMHVAPIALAKLRDNPVLMRKELELERSEDEHAYPQF